MITTKDVVDHFELKHKSVVGSGNTRDSLFPQLAQVKYKLKKQQFEAFDRSSAVDDKDEHNLTTEYQTRNSADFQYNTYSQRPISELNSKKVNHQRQKVAALGEKLDHYTNRNGNFGQYEHIARQIDSNKRNLLRFTNKTRMSKFSETPSLLTSMKMHE